MIVQRCSAHYMELMKKLKEDNTGLKIVYFNSNKHFDTFIANSNEEVLWGVDTVRLLDTRFLFIANNQLIISYL